MLLSYKICPCCLACIILIEICVKEYINKEIQLQKRKDIQYTLGGLFDLLCLHLSVMKNRKYNGTNPFVKFTFQIVSHDL